MARTLGTLGRVAAGYLGARAGVEMERDSEHKQYGRERQKKLDERTDRDYEEIDRPRRIRDADKQIRDAERQTTEHGDWRRDRDVDEAAREAARRAAEGAAPAAPPAVTPGTPAAEGGEGITTLPQVGAPPAPEPMPATGQAPDPTPLGGAAPAAGAPAPATGAPAPAATLSAAGAGAPAARTLSGNTPPAGSTDPAADTRALWRRTAEAQAEVYRKAGRPDKAAKVLQDAINAQIAEREAVFKYDLMPQMEAIRRQGVTTQQIEGDAKIADLRRKIAEKDVETAGLMWGHVLAGNKRAAIAGFNASAVTLPGVEIADIAQTADGKTILLLDKDGEVAKGKDGKPLTYPRQLLDNLYARASTTTTTVKKGESIVRTKKGVDGTTSVESLYTAPDPEAAGRERGRTQAQDAAWERAISKARDDGDRILRNTYTITTNPMGQYTGAKIANYQRATEIFGRKLAALRATGIRVDQVEANQLAVEASREADEQIKREAAGAGPRAAPGGAPAAPAAGPTWRDVVK